MATVNMGNDKKIIESKYPSNAHRQKANVEVEDGPEKKVTRIVQGKVVTRKKSLGKRFFETFFGEDTTNVGSYIIQDVLVPAAKSTVSDMVTGGIEMLLFGESRRDNRRRSSSGGYTSYSSYYNRKDDRRDRDRDDRRDDRRSGGSRHSPDEIILASRGEAEDVLGTLNDLVERYDVASVADLYDMVGIATSFTDNRYGWDDLRGSAIRPTRGGYLLILPKTILIN